jgi:hypothetical protein
MVLMLTIILSHVNIWHDVVARVDTTSIEIHRSTQAPFPGTSTFPAFWGMESKDTSSLPKKGGCPYDGQTTLRSIEGPVIITINIGSGSNEWDLIQS